MMGWERLELSMRETIAQRYWAMAQAGEIVPDAVQRSLVAALDELNRAIAERSRVSRRRRLRGLLSRRRMDPPLRGFYIWGGVGRGKTLIMDIFFSIAPTNRKRRVHFHQFMIEVHDRIAVFRRKLRSGEVIGDDPIPPVAADIASEIGLLCFDEFVVYDIADAMILGRLFEQLFARGVTVVATTNVAPDDLYKDGLNRALFLPFIALLKRHMSVFHLDAPRDYRLDSEGTERRYVTPLGEEAHACLDAHFRYLSGTASGEPVELSNKGRQIVIPEAIEGIARFKFEDLCSRPLGAGDFLMIAERFHTVLLADIPILSAARRNEAKRLINLVDTLYDRRVRLIVSAETEPHALWQGEEGTEAFEFRRTASRLMEMRSDAYWDGATSMARDKERSPGTEARAY
jgi:cell division protein ZapE